MFIIGKRFPKFKEEQILLRFGKVMELKNPLLVSQNWKNHPVQIKAFVACVLDINLIYVESG